MTTPEKLSTMTRHEAGQARIRAAKEHIEAAQVHLMHACAALCSIYGYIPEWNRASKLMQTVKAFWYRVDEKLQRAARGRTGEMDHDPTPAEHPHKGCCGSARAVHP